MQADKHFEAAFFAIVEDLGLTKEEIAEAAARIHFQIENVYREYVAAPEERRLEVLGHYAKVFAQGVRHANHNNPEPPTYSLQDVFPVLRPRAYFVHTQLRGQVLNQGKPLLSQLYTLPFSPHFAIGLVADTGAKMDFLTEEDIQRFNLPIEEIYEQALQNLRQAQPLIFKPLGQNGYISEDMGYGYDGSLLLLPEFVEHLPFTETAAIFVTNSNRLIIAKLADLSLQSVVMECVVQAIQTQHHPISAVPFVHTENGWREGADIDGSAFLTFWRRSWVKERLDDIAEQRALLGKLQPELILPNVSAVGLDLVSSETQQVAHTQLSSHELQKIVVTVSATEAPKALNEPFFLTDVLLLPQKEGAFKTLLLRTIMLELPGVIRTDNTYEPRLAYFSRNLTSVEVALIEEKQKPILRAMGGIQ